VIGQQLVDQITDQAIKGHGYIILPKWW